MSCQQQPLTNQDKGEGVGYAYVLRENETFVNTAQCSEFPPHLLNLKAYTPETVLD